MTKYDLGMERWSTAYARELETEARGGNGGSFKERIIEVVRILHLRKDKANLCLDHLTRNGKVSRSEAGNEQLTTKRG